jgi:hypothetical protein
MLWLLFVFSTFASSTALSASQEDEKAFLSEAELAQTLAPIALYPDTLLTHILIAATYPIEVIEAERWIKKQPTSTDAQRQSKAQNKGWDASIQALLAFPQVMAKLSDDLTWMQKLGDAFLQNEARVLASIQTLRQQAEQAGSLAAMDNVEIIKEQKIIIIEPAQPEIIYVPYYDTRLVYGQWYWAKYPPVYWHLPHHYPAYYGHFYWGHGVHISSHFYFSAFHWHNRYVIVNHSTRHGYHPRNKVVISHQAKRWNHQPKHRRGVSYNNGRLKQKYYGAIIHSNPKVHRRNSNLVAGSSHKVQVFSSTKQVSSHRNFSEKLKASPHQKNKVYSESGTNKVVKSTNKPTKSTNKQVHNKYRNTSEVKVYKANVSRTRSVSSTKMRQSTHHRSKHNASSQKQAVKKSAVRGGMQNKPRNKIR